MDVRALHEAIGSGLPHQSTLRPLCMWNYKPLDGNSTISHALERAQSY